MKKNSKLLQANYFKNKRIKMMKRMKKAEIIVERKRKDVINMSLNCIIRYIIWEKIL